MKLTDRIKIAAAAFRAAKITGGNPQTPQYWLQRLFMKSWLTASGIAVSEDNILKFSPIWAAINIISGAIGFLPFATYKRSQPDGDDRKMARSHPVFELLHRPNPYMSGQTFRETMQGHVLSYGNGYAEIERSNGGRALALWPLLPNTVELKVNPENDTPYYIVHTNTKDALLDFDNVFHIKGIGFDGLAGYNAARYMADNVGLGMAAERDAANLFANDSSPMGILKTTSDLSKETKDKIEKDWEEKHKGLDKKYRIAVLHGGLEWQQVGISGKDAQLIESRKFGVSDVARWFSIPPHMIGDLEKATFSNIEHQGIEFVVWTLQKWLKKWEEEANYKLFSKQERKSYFTEFIVDGLLRGDSKSRYEAYKMGRDGGWLSVNDIRRKENLSPVDGGDVYLEPLNMKPAGSDPDGSARALLYDAWRRIITKETKAIKKIAKNPADNGFIKEFYDQHTSFMLEILVPVLRLCGFSEKAETDMFIREYIDEHTRELAAAQNIEQIKEILDEWQNDVPAEWTGRLLKIGRQNHVTD